MMKHYWDLSIIEKIYIKQLAIEMWGKRLHYKKPDFLNMLNELQINYLLN